MLSLVIPTRNNPIGLAHLLGTLAAQSTASVSDLTLPHVVIADASDVPVIQHNQIARCLVGIPFTYRHLPAKHGWHDVNHQRTWALGHAGDTCLLLDDDLSLCKGYLQAAWNAAETLDSKKRPAIFGVTVDRSNERGYPDYHLFTPQGVTGDNFGFTPTSELCQNPNLLSYSATIGHMLARTEVVTKVFQAASCHSDNPAIVDDAVALTLARLSEGWMHTGLKAWHCGNGNNNWSYGTALKHPLVQAMADKIREELASC